MMKTIGWAAMLLVAASLSGCRSPHHDVVMADLMRQLDVQGDTPAASRHESPDTPMAVIKPSELLAGSVAGPTNAAFVPLNLIAAEGGPLTIQADSVLRITVAEDPGLSGSYPVNDLGGIQLGYIGPVILDNLTEAQAAAKIRDILTSREFLTANVTVKILRPSYDRVRIAGGVHRPGTIRVGAGDEISLNNALIQAGGIIDTPWRTQVKVVRGGLTSILAAYLSGEVYRLVNEKQEPSIPDVKLRNNDVVFVYSAAVAGGRSEPERARVVLVLGEVGGQGFHTFGSAESFTIMHLALRMGGFPPYANDRAVRVIRTNADGSEEEFRVNVREILKEGDPRLDFPLQSGDRIIVPSRRISLF